MQKIKDNNGKTMNYRLQYNGAVLTKGDREIYLLFKSVNAGEKARKNVAQLSFDKLFKKSKKYVHTGKNRGFINFEKLVKRD